MTRRGLALSMLTAFLAAGVTGQAQPPPTAYRVAWITPVADVSSTFNTFRQERRQRGYVEGENLSLEHRAVPVSPERLSGVMGELIRLNVDVIVAVAQPTVQAAQQATRSIPIVMFGVGDPV